VPPNEAANLELSYYNTAFPFVSISSPSPRPLSSPASVLFITDIIVLQGYSAFDVDKDGVISLTDLKGAAASLELDLSVSHFLVHTWFTAHACRMHAHMRACMRWSERACAYRVRMIGSIVGAVCRKPQRECANCAGELFCAIVSAASIFKEALHRVAAMLLVLQTHDICFLCSLALAPRARALAHPCACSLPVSLPRSRTARTFSSRAGRRAGTFLQQPGLTRVWVYQQRGLVCCGNACVRACACVCAFGTWCKGFCFHAVTNWQMMTSEHALSSSPP